MIALPVAAVAIVAAGQTPGNSGRPLALALPRVGWALEIRAPGFVVSQDETRPDGGYRDVYAVNNTTDVVLSRRSSATCPRKPSSS